MLGVKNEDLGEEVKAWEARCMFQGSNVRTKTCSSAADLFEETSNAPASFAAARAAIRVAALKGFNVFSAMVKQHISKRLYTLLHARRPLSNYPVSGGQTRGLKVVRSVRSPSMTDLIAAL